MTDRKQSASFILVCLSITVIYILGFISGKGCQKNDLRYGQTKDTVTKIQVIERAPYFKPDVKVKSILVPYRDTILVTKKLPCDSSFVLQSDSVITNTGDTVNMSLSHSKDNTYFSFLLRPRPDSIVYKTIQVPIIEKSASTDFAWIVSAFAIGIGIGILGATK